MAKPYTYPTLYDDLLKLSITKLKEWDYLSSNQSKEGVVTWSRNENKTAEISILVSMYIDSEFIQLNYNFNGESRHYKIKLVSKLSNLGKGKIWYFLCPYSNKRCRKLYLIKGYFVHREAFKGCMYDSQTKSKNNKLISKRVGSYFVLGDLYKELNSKYFKRTYNGKPTKRFVKIVNKIEQAKQLQELNLKNLF